MEYDGEIMPQEFQQLDWTDLVKEDCRQIVRLAVREDLDRGQDWTSVSLIPAESRGGATVVAREQGVVAGLLACQLALQEMAANITWSPEVEDGDAVVAGQPLARLEGSTRDILTTERIILNLLGRLSGIATLTRQYVDRVAPSHSKIYDTRKTTPGWRRLEKYAVRCGGGQNHRTGLFDAILIKDNHLASTARQETENAEAGEPGKTSPCCTPVAAIEKARAFIGAKDTLADSGMVIEIEVDSLEQLSEVLPATPDLVLLDNMSSDQLRQAVAMRDEVDAKIVLEASGGVNLSTVSDIAATGVDRISVGALTHSACALDVALDWSM